MTEAGPVLIAFALGLLIGAGYAGALALRLSLPPVVPPPPPVDPWVGARAQAEREWR
jgi:hypothetical protein